MAKKTSIYLQVAVDMARRIVSEEIQVGQKLSGRTTLASHYNVSPETIRKAMRLLADVQVVEVKHGNGIHVSSLKKAEEFVEQYKIKSNINSLKLELLDLMKQREIIESKMNETMNAIVDYTSRFKNSEHIFVNEYYLNYESLLYDKSIGELCLKENTGITLVGIIRDGITMLSLSEDEIIKAQDKLQYVGDANASLRLGEYLRQVYEISI